MQLMITTSLIKICKHDPSKQSNYDSLVAFKQRFKENMAAVASDKVTLC